MKKQLIITCLLLSIFACKKKDTTTNHDLIGTWQLAEVLFDPGDGSGTFQPVISNKTITFDNQLNVLSNGTLCDMSIDTNSGSSGTYSIADATILPADCPTNLLLLTHNADTLELRYPCFEPCRSKYIRK